MTPTILTASLRDSGQSASPDVLAVLDKYADDLCEGWCEKSPDCAHFDDCGGCLARRTAWQARGNQ